MNTFKSLLGTEVPSGTRGIVYLCKFHKNILQLHIISEIFFDNCYDALNAYANIPNPESQLVMAKDYEGLQKEIEKLKNNMVDKNWLDNLADCI